MHTKENESVFKPLRQAQTPLYFGCSECSLVWWVLKPLGAQSGYACDFRYGSSVYLPTTGGCLLLWRHLSRWSLLTCLWYASRWAVMTQAFCRANRSLKGPWRSRWLMQLHSPWCQSSPGNTEPQLSRCSQVTPTQCLTWLGCACM